MAKYTKRHFITSEAFKTQVSLLSSWHHPQKTFGPLQISITKSAIYGVIHHYASFSEAIQWRKFQMAISTFQQVIKAHLPEDSSRIKGNCHNLKYQRRHQAINVYSHSQYSSKGILAVHSQGIFKREFQNNVSRVNAPPIHLGNPIHSVQS
ncbi:hypothetical protein O181_094584 [Austropuccinia psidii MF-1]|uniref:Uncharacterized protein n=1 Tax=Austropuccinia psidii MF-1 TaxID=1389203 RepID=A0A9Q3PAY5_9BASI|nr:hypothetical protein [Austropuccinia psidii MF-1]